MGVNRDHFTRYSRPVLRTKRWKMLRHVILERDEWACVQCGSLKRLEVDHIEPVRNAPDKAFDPSNLQTLCASCHTKKTRVECGHKERSPARKEWDRAVEDLAAQNPVEQMEFINADI
ncbi:HNH endonuclease [Celeribacter halophilus]|jgi:5-methylcytosine-specific restriction endonuclease McrA|uniref:HNH endonuclease n=1 Tax=Celeribacter halophilus TaxID=576117 RepID=UPI0026E209DB|nr:HNH endonuclease [Celeribacter halophilus]MDO6722783.1 HNH endonuclease [Celeribacter halophilus]